VDTVDVHRLLVKVSQLFEYWYMFTVSSTAPILSQVFQVLSCIILVSMATPTQTSRNLSAQFDSYVLTWSAVEVFL